MASLTIRELPEKTKEGLRVKAARAGLSLESYTRELLCEAAQERELHGPDLVALAEQFFGARHGVELQLTRPVTKRAIPDFSA